MSNRKRNVAYVKPEEPNFLKKIKQQIGYTDKETIEMKKGPIDNFSDDEEDYVENEDEKPVVVQLKKGDLTEEEAAKLAQEEGEKPADLRQRIVFKTKKKGDTDPEGSVKKATESTVNYKKAKRQNPMKNLLSFEEEDDV